MENQITLDDYMNDYTYNRKGELKKSVFKWDRERCETCRHWEILPVELQPPAGWGVKGQCNCSHEPELMKRGYWIVGKTSYCQDYESRF